MGKDYNSPVRLVIKCNRAAADSMIPLLKEFRFMGNAGCSRSITIEDYGEHERDHRFGFDGDGPDKIDSIEVDGKLIKASGYMMEGQMEKARKMPVGTISHGRKKVAEGKWVPVKKEKKGSLPNDLRTLTVDDVANFIKRHAAMPLKTLRRNQDIVKEQEKVAYEKRNTEELEKLDVMEWIYQAAVDVKEFGDSTPKEWAKDIVSRLGKSIGEARMNLVIPLRKGCASVTKKKLKKADASKPNPKDFKEKFEYYKALMKWKAGNKTEKSIVLMPTEMLKAEHLGKVGSTQNNLNKVSSNVPEHKGAVKGKGNAKGTVGPRKPEGGGKTKPEGAPKAESSKKGGSPSRVKGRKPGDKPPYKNYKATASGSASSAASNYLKMTSEKDGKARFLKLGSVHRAKFDHAGNCIRVTVDSKRYPVQNHLVKLPSGVYRIDGMVTVANRVVGANK